MAHPEFALPEGVTAAQDAAAVAAAFTQGRKAYNGKRYEDASPALIQLIQAGRLVQVGYALPRPRALFGVEAEGITIGADGTVKMAALSSLGTAAPPVRD